MSAHAIIPDQLNKKELIADHVDVGLWYFYVTFYIKYSDEYFYSILFLFCSVLLVTIYEIFRRVIIMSQVNYTLSCENVLTVMIYKRL